MFVTVNELIGLPGLPGTVQSVRYTLNKCAAGLPEIMRRRQGTKAYEYNVDCLPDATREAVQARMARQLLAQPASLPVKASARGDLVAGAGGEKVQRELALYRKCPALQEKKLRGLTNSQKAVGDARMVLVQEVLRLMDSSENGGLSMKRKQAAEFIADASVAGTLPDYVQRAADIANARKGTSRAGVSVPTLQRWLSAWMTADTVGERMALLAPGKVGKKEVFQYSWMPDFMRHWRDTNKPTITMAYDKFENGGWSSMLATT